MTQARRKCQAMMSVQKLRGELIGGEDEDKKREQTEALAKIAKNMLAKHHN
jgi:hypothetical protein